MSVAASSRTSPSESVRGFLFFIPANLPFICLSEADGSDSAGDWRETDDVQSCADESERRVPCFRISEPVHLPRRQRFPNRSAAPGQTIGGATRRCERSFPD